MNPEIREIIQTIKPEIFMLLGWASIVGFLALVAQGIIRSYVAYYFFLTNEQL